MIKEWIIPENWNWIKLEGIAKNEKYSIVDGPFGSNLKTSDYVAEGVPVLQGKNITNNKFKWFGIRYISEDKADELKRSSVTLGDILIVKIGSIGYSAELNNLNGHERAIIPANLAKITVDENLIDKSYLLFWLKSIDAKRHFESVASKTAQPALSLSKIKALPIPLPPLTVQKQIAAALEKADTLRGQCQKMEQELNTLAQSVFLDMFGDPIANHKGWAKRKIKDLVADFKGGKSIAASESEENSGLNRVLKISAVTKGEFNPNESKPLPNSYEPPEDHFVKVDDLLFSRANTTELVGATSLVFKTPDNVLLPDKLWRFVWHDENAQSQVFMWQLLSNKSVRIELGKISSGSGGSMKNISKGKLYDFEIIYPEIETQLEFEVKFLKIRNQLSFIYELQKEALENFNSLMQRAFKGELALHKTKDVA